MLIALGAGRPDGWSTRRIEQAKLDANRVRDLAHDAAKGVDFANQMALGNSAYGGVAGHLRNQIYVQRVEGGLEAHARRSHGGFASGVTSADYDYVEVFGEGHLWFLF